MDEKAREIRKANHEVEENFVEDDSNTEEES